MSNHNEHHQTGVIKNFTSTVLLSFSIIFLLFISVSACHGNYHPKQTHHSTNAPSSIESHSEKHH